ncbi:MAG: DUF2971 domain-containing protein [Bacteroidales bacterium]|nr:DUF2971 domain-containing protein [Bacteroidales bacterium]
MGKGYKYRGGIGSFDKDGNSIFERDVNTLVKNQIFLPTKKELNDPTEGFYNDDAIRFLFEALKEYSAEVKRQYVGLLEKFAQVGIYSLSNNVTNELLWAYYGSGHLGFAIEYDIDKLKESLNHNQYFQSIFDFDVEYSRSIPIADISMLHEKDIIRTLKTFLGTKSRSWKHEEEYRLIIDGKGLFDIDYRAITGIYFGYRMQEEEIDYIMKKLKGRGLSYYKMGLIENTYKFTPLKIEDKYPDATKYVANCIDYDVDELLMSGVVFGEEAQLYRDKFIDALESIKNDPLIKDFYIATVNTDSIEPLLKIFANTKSGMPPIREFNFKLNEKGEIYRTK